MSVGASYPRCRPGAGGYVPTGRITAWIAGVHPAKVVLTWAKSGHKHGRRPSRALTTQQASPYRRSRAGTRLWLTSNAGVGVRFVGVGGFVVWTPLWYWDQSRLDQLEPVEQFPDLLAGS